MLRSTILKKIALIGGCILITSLLLTFAAHVARESIAKSEREAKQKALFDIVSDTQHDNDLLTDTLTVPADAWEGLGLKSGGTIHVARHADETMAILIPATAPDGYSGAIRLIVGINRDGTIAGVRVLEHNETPGLGDKIDVEKSQWILQFKGETLNNTVSSYWRIKKDGGNFDQLAGATITSRAIVNRVRRVMEFVDSHRDELFKKNSDIKPPSSNAVTPN